MSNTTIPSPARYDRREAIDLIIRGGFPEIRPLDGADRMERYSSYIGSIVERDIAPVAEVRRRGAAFVVYLGDRVLSFGPGRLALPLSIFWSYRQD